MNGDRVYKGIIMKKSDNLPKYQVVNGINGKRKTMPITDEIYKKNAVLIKVGEDKYIDLDTINGSIDLLKSILKKEVLITKPSSKNDKYVKKDSLVPYYSQKSQSTNVKQLKLNKKAYDLRH